MPKRFRRTKRRFVPNNNAYFDDQIVPLLNQLKELLEQTTIPYAMAFQVDSHYLEFVVGMPPERHDKMIFEIDRNKHTSIQLVMNNGETYTGIVEQSHMDRPL